MILLLIMLTQITPSQSELWEQANQAYADEDYRNALSSYHLLLDQGIENGLLYYNMGNTYFKLGDIGRSALYYYKAQKLRPGDEDIQHNLSLVNQVRVDPVIDEEQDRFLRSVDRMLYRLPYSVFFVLSALGILVAFALSLVAIFRAEFNRSLGYVLVISALVGVLSLTIASIQYRHMTRDDFGVIVAERVDMLSGPSKKETTIYSIHAGIRCQILDEANGWYRIRLANGYNGWIPSGRLQRI